MKNLNMKIRFDAERFLAPVLNVVEGLIRQQLAGVPILHRERSDDGKSHEATIVYMHSVRREREGYRCRFFIVAYDHRPGETPPKGPVRAYIMEYPLITKSSRIRGSEYTVPELESPWAT